MLRSQLRALLLALLAVNTNPTKPWKQDRFAIGSFLDPPPTDDFYGQFRAANFTVMLSTYTTNASTMSQQAAMCKAHDLRCILSGPVSQFPTRGPAMQDCKGRVDPAHLFEPAAYFTHQNGHDVFRMFCPIFHQKTGRNLGNFG